MHQQQWITSLVCGCQLFDDHAMLLQNFLGWSFTTVPSCQSSGIISMVMIACPCSTPQQYLHLLSPSNPHSIGSEVHCDELHLIFNAPPTLEVTSLMATTAMMISTSITMLAFVPADCPYQPSCPKVTNCHLPTRISPWCQFIVIWIELIDSIECIV